MQKRICQDKNSNRPVKPGRSFVVANQGDLVARIKAVIVAWEQGNASDANSQSDVTTNLVQGLELQLWKTREQLAVRYQVCVRTVDYWTEHKILPCYKCGSVLRFHVQECDEALKKFRSKSRFEDGEKGGLS